jgi:hypothetical protein
MELRIEVSSSDQLFQYGESIWRFGVCFLSVISGSCDECQSLMMETDTAAEKSYTNSLSKRLITKDDFIVYSNRESFKSYVMELRVTMHHYNKNN